MGLKFSEEIIKTYYSTFWVRRVRSWRSGRFMVLVTNRTHNFGIPCYMLCAILMWYHIWCNQSLVWAPRLICYEFWWQRDTRGHVKSWDSVGLIGLDCPVFWAFFHEVGLHFGPLLKTPCPSGLCCRRMVLTNEP